MHGPLMGYGYGGWQYMGWMMAANGIFWLALLGIAAWLIYRLAPPSGRAQPGARPSAMDILEERYARGEVERDEYLQKKQDILGPGGA